MSRSKGAQHYRAKLTEDDVRMILRLRDEGISSRSLARKYEVSQSAIARIWSARNWNHI